MLLLTRRTNEKIMIGKTVTVTLLQVRGNQVQLGIDAPKQIPVHRNEIYNLIQQGKEAKA